MKKTFVITFILCLLTGFCRAQNKQFTMQEATLGLRKKLAPENIKQLHWIPGGAAFARETNDTVNPVLLRVEVPSLKTDTLLALRRLKAAIPAFDSLDHLPVLKWMTAHSFYFKAKNQLYLGQENEGIWTVKKWHRLPENADKIFVHGATLQIAYTLENNLYMIDAYGTTKQITHSEQKWVINGQIVSRNEFGIDSGVFFSPKGNYLAFYRMDETGVSDYPIINWSNVPATVHTIKYPMAGTTSQEVTLGVYNVITGETTWMQTGRNTDHYLTNVTWGPDEKYIYIGILNRDQNHLKLNQYAVRTGAFVKTLFEETDPKYVHPMHPLYFIPGYDDQFLWWSERDGFMHLYRYNTEGKLLNRLAEGNWVVNAIYGWNTADNEVIIGASSASPMSRNIYAVNWRTGRMRRLDQAPGMHQALVNDLGTYWIDRFSNFSAPRVINVASVSGKWHKNLLTADNPLKEYDLPEIREVTLQADDGTPLYGKIILPTDFDATKKYPVIVYLYNGPGVQLLHHQFPESGNLWYDYMAQHGYIVFTMDGRGSTNRGLKFEQATFRHLGTVELEDQLKGVAYLKSLPYVDSNRMGIHGWSFGGFMTISMMLRHPGVFRCAVAGGPVIDWRMYEVMYTERYMDRPQDNPKGYEQANLLTKTKNLKGKLLVIHGSSDSTVVWQHSMRFIKACVDHNVPVDYFVYPGHPHNVRGSDRVHLMRKITNYFNEYLKR